jgi:hypothetical protein
LPRWAKWIIAELAGDRLLTKSSGQGVKGQFGEREVFSVIGHQRKRMFKGSCSDHPIRQGEGPAFPCRETLEGAGAVCDRTGDWVALQAGKRSFRSCFFSGPHTGMDLRYVDGGSGKQVSAGDPFRQDGTPILTPAQHVEQNGGVEVKQIYLPSSGEDSDAFTGLDMTLAENARSLSDQMPSPRQVRIVGKLDMVRHRTRSFALLLADGKEIREFLRRAIRSYCRSISVKKSPFLEGQFIARPARSFGWMQRRLLTRLKADWLSLRFRKR